MAIDESITRALRNIGTFGDTDIFPYLFERYVFADREGDCKTLLRDFHDKFETWMNEYPPDTHESLTQVGYTGFRWATQIEPFWNAYYLALVIELADQIEADRVPAADGIVYSYRYEWDERTRKLFKDSTWIDYRRRAIELAGAASYVVLTDVADFYPRIYHHRIENALKRLPQPGDFPMRIMKMLGAFARGGASYGLPIGGPASRILAELALNGVDKLLVTRRIRFCRYADDYCMFCDTKADAYRSLVYLSEKLFNEGLVLQKKKTKILSVGEFLETGKLLDPNADAQSDSDEQKLLRISIRFDPYSANPEEDYEALKAAVHDVNVVGILGREVAKTVIDTAVAKQAIEAIRALEPANRDGAIRTLLDQENLEVLSPVFVTIMRLVRAIYNDLPDATKEFVDSAMINIFDNQFYALSVEINLSYFIQALAQRHAPRKQEILAEIYDAHSSPVVRRLVISTMANWNCHFWISDIKQRYGSLNEWERRSLIVASYILGDEGSHWRRNTKASWNRMQLIIKEWFSARAQTNNVIPL